MICHDLRVLRYCNVMDILPKHQDNSFVRQLSCGKGNRVHLETDIKETHQILRVPEAANFFPDATMMVYTFEIVISYEKQESESWPRSRELPIRSPRVQDQRQVMNAIQQAERVATNKA